MKNWGPSPSMGEGAGEGVSGIREYSALMELPDRLAGSFGRRMMWVGSDG